jgi:hypothetical protein
MSGKDEEQIRLLKLIAAPEIRRRRLGKLLLGCVVIWFVFMLLVGAGLFLSGRFHK